MDALVQHISDYVQQLFKDRIKPELTYHNLAHTRKVVERTNEMIRYYELSAHESRIVQVAAWFHDVGYLFLGRREHEKESVAIMSHFMRALDVDNNTIGLIADCIMCTQLPANPKNLLQEILCDADTYHLGTDEFLSSDEALKHEFTLCEQILVDDWDSKTLRFLEQHQFFTGYCKQLLNVGKQRNIEVLLARINQ